MSRPNHFGLSSPDPSLNRFRIAHLVPNLSHGTWSPDGQSGLRCRSDDARIMHSRSLSVNRRSQPMEEPRPKKRLDQVRACPERSKAIPPALDTIAIAPRRPESAGSNAPSTSAACATGPKWPLPRGTSQLKGRKMHTKNDLQHQDAQASPDTGGRQSAALRATAASLVGQV